MSHRVLTALTALFLLGCGGEEKGRENASSPKQGPGFLVPGLRCELWTLGDAGAPELEAGLFPNLEEAGFVTDGGPRTAATPVAAAGHASISEGVFYLSKGEEGTVRVTSNGKTWLEVEGESVPDEGVSLGVGFHPFQLAYVGMNTDPSTLPWVRIVVERAGETTRILSSRNFFRKPLSSEHRALGLTADGEPEGKKGDGAAKNRPPKLAIRQTVTERFLASKTIRFRAEFEDPDGDPVTVHWLTGDGAFGTGASVTRTFGEGRYAVTCIAEDGRGGETAVVRKIEFAGPAGVGRSISITLGDAVETGSGVVSGAIWNRLHDGAPKPGRIWLDSHGAEVDIKVVPEGGGALPPEKIVVKGIPYRCYDVAVSGDGFPVKANGLPAFEAGGISTVFDRLRSPELQMEALGEGGIGVQIIERLPPVRDMEDSINHARSRFPGSVPPYKVWRPEDVDQIAETVLAFQREDGGWPKNFDPLRRFEEREIRKVKRELEGPKSTLDNRTTWSQIRFLAELGVVAPEEMKARCHESVRKGILWILSQQNPVSGGWRGADVDAVTFNDDVMVGVLKLLREVSDEGGRGIYDFLGDELKARCRLAWKRGLECVLDAQVRIDGELTIWAQQHDHKSLQPVKARSYELPALSTLESAYILRMLMGLDAPDTRVKEAIRAGVRWLDTHRIEGIRIANIAAGKTKYRWHVSDRDRVVVADPGSPPIWTRFYDLESGCPTFFTRKSKIVKDYTEVSRERRTGYGWWGSWGGRILEEDYPLWQARHDPGQDVLEDSGPPLYYSGKSQKLGESTEVQRIRLRGIRLRFE